MPATAHQEQVKFRNLRPDTFRRFDEERNAFDGFEHAAEDSDRRVSIDSTARSQLVYFRMRTGSDLSAQFACIHRILNCGDAFGGDAVLSDLARHRGGVREVPVGLAD